VRAPLGPVCCRSLFFAACLSAADSDAEIFGGGSRVLYCLCLLDSFIGLIFGLSDQKARVFLVLIAFTRWFSEHICKLFGEIPVKT
jgi:hypothetical protein